MKNSLDVLSDKLAKILGQLDQIEGMVGKAGGSGGSGGVMSGSLAPVTTTAAPASNGGFFMDFMGKATNAAAGVTAGLSLAMPDTGMAIARRRGFYEAGVASGGIISHGALERSVRLGLGGFSTSVGSDSAVAAMLTNRGMVAGSSTFNSTVTGVGQAARYLNMSNEVAASALEGLTSGSTSANLMRNFGVFTSNPSTGKAMGQAEIFEQLAQRFTGGRATTVEGTLESLRRGNLGSNIRNSGLDEAQQKMLSQYMIDRARGITMDLEDPDAISKAIERNDELNISNPMLLQYAQNSKDNQLLERATDDYITGMEVVSEGLLKLKDAISGLPDLFYKLKGGADFFLGDRAGQGALAAGSSLINEFPVLGSIVTGITANNIFNNGGNPLETFFPNEMRAFGDTGNRVGNQLGAIPTLINPFEFIPAMFGAQSNAHRQASNTFNNNQTTIISDFFSGLFGGGNSGGSDGSTTVPGPDSKNWSGKYGEQREGGKTHKGIDVPLPVGTPLKAVMDGVVSAAQSGSGARSYGLYVIIEHSGGKSTLYAHMSKIMVKVGDNVTKGQIIGLSGNTGFSTGPHLHFELRVNGVQTNPAAYVRAAYGPGGTQANNPPMQEDGNVTGASATVVPNNFISASWAGVTGGSSNVKDIILSGGSLGSLPTGSVADIPDSISGNRRSAMMGVQLSKVLKNNSPAIGGGEEPLGVSEVSSGNVGSNKQYGKSSKSNVTINVTIASASETEARRFAKLVKQQLEEDSVLTSMGRK